MSMWAMWANKYWSSKAQSFVGKESEATEDTLDC